MPSDLFLLKTLVPGVAVLPLWGQQSHWIFGNFLLNYAGSKKQAAQVSDADKLFMCSIK